MTRCGYRGCVDAADGLFNLAPGLSSAEIAALYRERAEDPVPLCHWHALLVGDQRVPSQQSE